MLAGLAAVSAETGAAAGTKRDIDRTKATELLDRLEDLLAKNNTKAVEVADELRGVVAGSPLAPILEKVAAAIGDYDFDIALEHTRAARTALGTV